MNRLKQSENQRQRILDALADGPLTMVELRWATGLSNQRLAQYLLRMTETKEVSRTRDGKRPDSQPCYLYSAAVSQTIQSSAIAAKLAANVNGGIVKELAQPLRKQPVVRIFGGLYVPGASA